MSWACIVIVGPCHMYTTITDLLRFILPHPFCHHSYKGHIGLSLLFILWHHMRTVMYELFTPFKCLFQERALLWIHILIIGAIHMQAGEIERGMAKQCTQCSRSWYKARYEDH